MTYSETCEFLYNQLPMFEKQGANGYKEGLDNTIALDEHFGHPHRNYRTIHVAGTNGKGSCAHTLSAILQMCGYKVGLYTSPHLVDFSERIRINGEPISEEYVIDFVEKEKAFFQPLSPSFFEIVTAMAFKYFDDMKVDIAVIEVGMGGRLDCTNIITPVLSVITNIGLDHTQFLGTTLEQIAIEKAGIMKKDVPVVIGETTPETKMVFEAMSTETHTPIVFAEDEQEIITAIHTNHGTEYRTKNFGILTGELMGYYQEKNTNTILCAVKELEKTICDTGHNVEGWEYLSKQISAVNCHHKHIVFGMVEDKDFEGVMNLLPKDATYYYTQAKNHRAISGDVLKMYGMGIGLSGESFPDVATAYRIARDSADNGDLVFIGGSSYVVADFLKNCI